MYCTIRKFEKQIPNDENYADGKATPPQKSDREKKRRSKKQHRRTQKIKVKNRSLSCQHIRPNNQVLSIFQFKGIFHSGRKATISWTLGYLLLETFHSELHHPSPSYR